MYGYTVHVKRFIVEATVAAFVAAGFSFDDEPTVNYQDELTVATSGSHNLSRRSNGSMQLRDVGVGLALPGVPQGECGTGGTASCPPTVKEVGQLQRLTTLTLVCWLKWRRSAALILGVVYQTLKSERRP